MSLSLLAESSKASWPSGALCSLYGPRTFTGPSRTCATASLAQRLRSVRALLRRSAKHKRAADWYDKLEVDKRPQYVHRLVMSTLLGRPLRRDEHVHHVDGDKQNNRPDNLQLLSAGEHCWRTHHRHPVVVECAWCQALFRPKLSEGKLQRVLLAIVRRLPPLAALRGRVLRQPQGRARETEMPCRALGGDRHPEPPPAPARCFPL